MYSLNRAMVIGNATRDPELRTTPNGKSVAGFAVATNRRYTDAAGEQRDEVQYHEIVAWGKLAEIAQQIIHKGEKVYVDGRIQTKNWEGQDGNKREKTEIIAENLIALSPRGGGQRDYDHAPKQEVASPKPSQPVAKEEKKEDKPAEDEINLDEIPF